MSTKEQDFIQLMKENKGIIYKVCNSYCASKDDRDDLAQEIIYNLWKSFNSFNNEFRFSTWMYRVALNVAISFYRQERKAKHHDPIMDELIAFDEASADKSEVETNLLLLQNFINGLKEIDKAIILLYLDDKSHREIAQVTGFSETNVATRINRIKNKLRIRFFKQIKLTIMELDELKTAWLSNESRLDKAVKLNEHGIELIQNRKLASRLAPLYWQRVIECMFHSIAILLLVGFLFKNISQFPYAVSAIALLVFYTTTFINALKQINLIKSMNFNKDLATTQSSLVMLQTHIINYAKLTILFIPTFLAYPVVLTKVIKDFDIKAFADFDIIAKSNGNWWTLELVALIVLVPAGIWFYKEISYRNMDKKWVRDFIQKSSGTRVAKALEFLKELQGLKHSIN